MNRTSERLALRTSLLGAVLLLATPAAQAQDAPLALVNARILTMVPEQGAIERGTIVVRDGRIEALGADVRVPPGAEVVDVAGGTVMPGLVHVWSKAGTQVEQSGPELPADLPERFRRRFGGGGGGGGARPVAQAAKQIAPSIYARQDVFRDLLAKGVTTLIVRPDAPGFPGLAARLDPGATTDAGLTLDAEAYVVVQPDTNTAVGKVLKENFEKAQKVVAERKAPPPAEPKPEEKPAEPKEGGEQPKPPAEGEQPKETPKEGEQQPEPPKPAEARQQPAPKKDPNVEVLADLLEGKRRAFVELSSGTDLLHYRYALKDLKDLSFPMTVIADAADPSSGRLDEIADQLRALNAIVLLEPSLQTVPFTQTLVNVPQRLHAAGLEIGFVLDDSPRQLGDLWFELMELVRCGLPADVALAACTRVPAKAAGLDAEVGTLATGKRADLLVFSGDPLDPTSRLVTVYCAGRAVPKDTTR
ncbi:MAG: amidohydrolase family protein [Planctomycetes bacterium]|nr:amidohydrolase family protein [Planctomycetota bacterium]